MIPLPFLFLVYYLYFYSLCLLLLYLSLILKPFFSFTFSLLFGFYCYFLCYLQSSARYVGIYETDTRDERIYGLLDDIKIWAIINGRTILTDFLSYLIYIPWEIKERWSVRMILIFGRSFGTDTIISITIPSFVPDSIIIFLLFLRLIIRRF